MHRSKSWELNNVEFRTQRNRILPIEGGDGSTLSLDFTTMSSLDSRFTFSRTSDATFINSSGLVQYADANLLINADFVGAGTGNTPTSWTGSTGVNLTIPSVGVRRAETTAAAMNYIQSPNLTTNNGLTYSTSVFVNAVSGQHYANTLTMTGGASLVGYYLNGVSVGQFATAQPGLITVVWTANGTHTIRIGVGSTGVNVANAVCEFTQPRTVVGNFTQPAFFANPSTTAAYQAPRFDYDPTTLTPRGLLIEGSATNLLNWSESFATTGGTFQWNYNLYVTRNATQIIGPNGSATAYQFNETTDNQIHRISYPGATGSAGSYVLSVWVKVIDTNTPRRLFINANSFMGAGALFDIDPATQTGASGNAVAVAGTAANRAGTWVKYPNNWYRCSVLGTYVANTTIYFQINRSSSTTATDDTFAGSISNGLSFWGAQLEAGSGASSYIATGASTATRVVDRVSMVDISSMQWNQTSGTFFLNMDVQAETNTSGFTAFMGMYTAAPVRVVRVVLNNSSGTNNRIGVDTWTSTPSAIVSTSMVTRPLAPTAFKYAFALTNTGQTLNHVVNGGAVSTATGTGVLQTPTRMLLHQDPSAVDTEYFPIHIRSLRYYPTNLPDATLQSLTA